MSDRFHIVLYMSLVDDQRLHTIVRLLFGFSHAARKLVEGSLDEKCASTAPKSAQPPKCSMRFSPALQSLLTWVGRICARPGRLDHDEPAHQGMPEADLHLLWWTPQKAPSSWWTPSFYMKMMGVFLGLIAAMELRSQVSPSVCAMPRPFMVKC